LGRARLGDEELGFVGEGLELDRVACRVEEEHGPFVLLGSKYRVERCGPYL
jgi:hypothetical protein